MEFSHLLELFSNFYLNRRQQEAQCGKDASVFLSTLALAPWHGFLYAYLNTCVISQAACEHGLFNCSGGFTNDRLRNLVSVLRILPKQENTRCGKASPQHLSGMTGTNLTTDPYPYCLARVHYPCWTNVPTFMKLRWEIQWDKVKFLWKRYFIYIVIRKTFDFLGESCTLVLYRTNSVCKWEDIKFFFRFFFS